METHIKVCMKSDWSTYVTHEDFDRLKEAIIDKRVVEVQNLFGTRELIDGGDVATAHISTVESRLKYEQFAQRLSDEEEEAKPKEKKEWEE